MNERDQLQLDKINNYFCD